MGGGRAKFACSIDPALLERVERLRTHTGESRSAVVSRALAKLTREEVRAARVRRYIEAYHEHPESQREIRGATASARRALADLPWDEG